MYFLHSANTATTLTSTVVGGCTGPGTTQEIIIHGAVKSTNGILFFMTVIKKRAHAIVRNKYLHPWSPSQSNNADALHDRRSLRLLISTTTYTTSTEIHHHFRKYDENGRSAAVVLSYHIVFQRWHHDHFRNSTATVNTFRSPPSIVVPRVKR